MKRSQAKLLCFYLLLLLLLLILDKYFISYIRLVLKQSHTLSAFWGVYITLSVLPLVLGVYLSGPHLYRLSHHRGGKSAWQAGQLAVAIFCALYYLLFLLCFFAVLPSPHGYARLFFPIDSSNFFYLPLLFTLFLCRSRSPKADAAAPASPPAPSRPRLGRIISVLLPLIARILLFQTGKFFLDQAYTAQTMLRTGAFLMYHLAFPFLLGLFAAYPQLIALWRGRKQRKTNQPFFLVLAVLSLFFFLFLPLSLFGRLPSFLQPGLTILFFPLSTEALEHFLPFILVFSLCQIRKPEKMPTTSRTSPEQS